MPSPTQNVPNEHNRTPTMNLSMFSGIMATGLCSAAPRMMTRMSAARAPRLAGSNSTRLMPPMAMTMKTTSMPSTIVILNEVATATRSHPWLKLPKARNAALSFAYASSSSCKGRTPATRSIAFRSHRIPNSSKRLPRPSWTISCGMRTIAGPSIATRSARSRRAMPVPPRAPRQPRTVPTASTTVRASTNSTSEARNAATIVGATCAQLMIIVCLPSRYLDPPSNPPQRLCGSPDLNSQVRQRLKPRELGAVEAFLPLCRRDHGHDRAEMSRPQPPQMKVGEFITFAFDRLADIVAHMAVRVHIEQDRTRVAGQPVRPTGDDARADDARERVHPGPAKSAGQDQADDDQHRYGGVGDDVNSGSAHVVVASRRAVCVLMFLKNDGVGSPVDSDIGVESVRLRNFIDGFQKVAAIDERKELPRSVRSHGFNGHSRRRKFRPGLGVEPEPRRDPILVHAENGFAVSSHDQAAFVMRLVGIGMTVPVTVAVMVAAAEQPRARDIYSKTEAGDRDGFGEVNRHGREQAADGLIADQQRDHCEDDRAREPGEVAKLAGPKSEARVVGVSAGVGIGECRKQKSPCVGAHMEPVGHESDRAKHEAADDLRHHHGGAEPDHQPGLAFALFMPFGKEHMAMESRIGGGVAHGKPHLR